jgi:hypothetical protein
MRGFAVPLWLVACGGGVLDTDVPVELSGPILELSRTEVDFGQRPIRKSGPPIEVVIRNLGDEPLDVYEIWSDDQPFAVEGMVEGLRVRVGSEGTFIVTFRPDDPGPHAGTVWIDSNTNRGAGPLSLPLLGEGVAGELVVAPAALVVGSSVAELALANDGATTLTLTSAMIVGDPGFLVDLLPGVNGDLPMDLEPRDPDTGRPFRTIQVRFAAERSDGTKAGTLTLSSNDWNTPTLAVPLSVKEGG